MGVAGSTSSAHAPTTAVSATRRSSCGHGDSASAASPSCSSTNTWQAYNFHDADGDGWGDSWYVSAGTRSVDVTRPFLDFGVPFRFRDWDLAFIAWLNRTGKKVDFLSDDDLEAARDAATACARPTTCVVFPGHEEYVTQRALDVVERYRALGGNLLFLSANNFFCRVRPARGGASCSEQLWRELGPPGVVARRRAVRRLRLRAAPGAVRGHGRRARAWVFDGDRARERLGVRALRDRARRADGGFPAGDGPARRDPRPDGSRPLRRDDVLRDARRGRGSSPRACSTSRRRSTTRRSRGSSTTSGRGCRPKRLGVAERPAGAAPRPPARCARPPRS